MNQPLVNEAAPLSTKAERRALKRQLRDQAARHRQAKGIVKKFLGWAVVILVVVLIGRWFINLFPQGLDFSRAFEIQGRQHIADGVKFNGYNSNPPTSGPHYAAAADLGFYKTPLPDEQLVHNLEHGHIWIAYRPDLPEAVINQVRGLTRGLVIATPRSANETDIALAAWGRLDKLDLASAPFDIQRIRDFIRRYQNRGPENLNLPVGHIRR